MPGATELAIILVIVLILFGAGRLPQVFEAVGTGIKRFREAQADDAEPADVTPPAPARKAISEGEAVATEAEEVRTSTASR
jgi:sec-independent protein translocase protein TatA